MDLFAPSHLIILLVIVLVIFGPSRLGEVGGALGKAIRDFKKSMNEPESPATTTPGTPGIKSAETKSEKVS